MKKTLALILAAVTVILASFGSVTAFAAENIVTWNYDEGVVPDDYVRCGEIKEGTTKISPVGSGEENRIEYVCYDFKAEKAGYYLVERNESYGFYISFADRLEGSNAYGLAEYEELETENTENCKTVYYLEEGMTSFGATFFYGDWYVEDYSDCRVTIEYCGESVADIEFAEGSFENLILNDDIDNERMYIDVDATISFSSGKTIDVVDHRFDYTLKDEVVSGENEVEAVFINYSETVTAIVRSIEDYVESVEIVNTDDFNVVGEDYRDMPVFTELADIVLKVKYTDGKIEEYKINYGRYIEFETKNENNSDVDMPIKRNAYVYADYKELENGSYVLTVTLAEKEYASYPCTVEKLDFAENFGVYKSNIVSVIGSAAYLVQYYADMLFADDVDFQSKVYAAFSMLKYAFSPFCSLIALTFEFAGGIYKM